MAGLSFLITALQLWRRFKDRRLWRTKATIGLFLFISVLSGVVTGLISNIDSSALRYASVGASYPFWAPRPGRESRKTGAAKASQDGKALAALADAIWKVVGYLTDRLDMRLSQIKKSDVDHIVNRLELDFPDAVRRGEAPEIPLWETVRTSLQYTVDYLSDTGLKDVRQAELAAAAKRASEEGGNITALASLAYDWRVEGELKRLFEPKLSSPPAKPKRRLKQGS